MYPELQFFHSSVPTYLLCAVLGITVSILLLDHLLLERLILKKYIGVYLVSGIGLLVGAKAFGFLSYLLGQYAVSGILLWKERFFQSGIVYYGGLIGFLGTLWILCHLRSRNWSEIADVTAVIIPLFHTFGRLGCFLGGCCYGKVSDCWIAFPYRIAAEPEIQNRVPTALLEAGVEFLLFLLCLLWYQKKKRQNRLCDGQILLYYLVIYAAWRFIIEFWRGDTIRGVFVWISFSQIVSVWVFILCITKKFREGHRK